MQTVVCPVIHTGVPMEVNVPQFMDQNADPEGDGFFTSKFNKSEPAFKRTIKRIQLLSPQQGPPPRV
jgi:hypothetical protein